MSLAIIEWSIVFTVVGVVLILLFMPLLWSRKKKIYMPGLAVLAVYITGIGIFMNSSFKDTPPMTFYAAIIATSTAMPPTAIPTRTPLPTPQGTPVYVPSVKHAAVKPTAAYPNP